MTKAVLAHYDEAYLEAPDPKGACFTDDEPKCGFLETVEGLRAAEASRPSRPPSSPGCGISRHKWTIGHAFSMLYSRKGRHYVRFHIRPIRARQRRP